jgi:hypothetical protein
MLASKSGEEGGHPEERDESVDASTKFESLLQHSSLGYIL